MTTQNFEALNFRVTPKAEFQDDAFCKKSAALFEDGATKAEAAEKLGVSEAVAHLAWSVQRLGRISFKSQEELAKAVVQARDEGEQAWSIIGARAGGLTESRVQSLYEEGSGDTYIGSRLTRSTRQRTEPRPPAEKKTPAKAAPKKAAAKKATGKKPSPRKRTAKKANA